MYLWHTYFFFYVFLPLRSLREEAAPQQAQDRFDQDAEVDGNGEATLPETLKAHAPRQSKGADSRPVGEEGADSLDAVRERLRESLAKRRRGSKQDEL